MKKHWLLTLLGIAIAANAILIALVASGNIAAVAESQGAAKAEAAEGGGHGGGGGAASSSSNPSSPSSTVHILPADAKTLASTQRAEAERAVKKEVEEVYVALVNELTEQKKTLERKQAELVERERQLGVLRAEFEVQGKTAPAEPPAAASAKPTKPTEAESFKKLVKTYAGMEPENAAKALIELYARDRDGAVELMLALPARKASAVLDAITARKTSIAAEISFEMQHKDDPTAQ